MNKELKEEIQEMKYKEIQIEENKHEIRKLNENLREAKDKEDQLRKHINEIQNQKEWKDGMKD